MSSELNFQNQIQMHQSASGGYSSEGSHISIKGNGSTGFGGVHFHSDPLTVSEATDLLRKGHRISNDEIVLELRSCGKDKRGVEGFAARTYEMVGSSEPDVSDEDYWNSVDTVLRLFRDF